MAPAPTTQGASLQDRLLQLVQTLQFAWFAGHVTLLLCTIRYALSYVTFHSTSKWARFSYRTAFIAATVTYGIVVYKSLRARARAGKSQGGSLSILTDENVQYLFMALVWLYSHQVPLAIFPFAVYSLFHVATYTRSNLLPVLSPAPASSPAAASPGGAAAARPKSSSPIADTIGRFVKDYYDTSMTVVAILEITLWFRLLLPALTFAKGTWVLLLLYSAFVRARYAQSTFVQGAFTQIGARIDAFANKQDSPDAVKQMWHTIKGVIAQAVAATDLNRFAGAPAPVKKAQ